MQDIREYLKQNVLIEDGALGTYISSLTGRSAAACELLNRSNPELVSRVHREYVRGGARMILTNTFCANTVSLRISGEETSAVVRTAVRIAKAAAGEEAYVAGDIGPVPDTELDGDEEAEEYRRMIDAMLEEGIRIFQLETFARADAPVRAAKYIREKAPDAFILICFAVTPDGYSSKGLRASTLIAEVRESGAADAAGFNCCSGPAHLLAMASKIDYGTLIPCLLPNAGYPEQEDEVLIYNGSPDYFADQLSEAPAAGFRIVGGCCGTTPLHIHELSLRVAGPVREHHRVSVQPKQPEIPAPEVNPFREALSSGKKVVVVELEPPFTTDTAKLERAAQLAKQAGAHALTVADSPMARPRADSVLVAARLRRIVGIDVIPHICCRDKNVNALKSSLIAAHMEGIRSLLAVTGDPVPETDRSFIKSVFNFNSVGLCALVRDLNSEIFQDAPLLCGCAFNVNARNIGEELAKLEKKRNAGASFVLTQPVFTPEAVEALKRAAGMGVKVFAGILTPLSYKNARFLANEIPGINLPPAFVERFSPDMTREQGEETGIAIAAAMAEAVAPYAAGFYFMTPFNRVEVTARLMDKLRDRGIL